ncbi:MAG: glucose-1-phosphate thymidylyltransferase [Dehalococcoidia bacterium]|nr:glucose-1-phosphate thymidylyltransferase [Dehalococcoidia bacterium]
MIELPVRLKGLILSGGKGSRLRPFTYTGAKQLVPIANKPILFYAIESLRQCGVHDIGIVVGDTKEQVKAAVGDGSRFDVSVTYIEQEAPLGIAHAVKVSRDFIGDDPFVLFLGDNFIREGIIPFACGFCRDNPLPAAQVLLCPVSNASEFGVADLKDGRLARVIEKPAQPPTNLAVIGIYMFGPQVFEAVNAIRPSARGELEITDTIQYLIDHGHDVRCEIVDGCWIDTGKMGDLLEANRAILETLEPASAGAVDGASRVEGRVVLEAGCEIVNSVVRGPSIIGERTRIVNSYVGPFTSVYHDCVVEGSEIEQSVVMENTVIRGVTARIQDSLIGRNVELTGSDARPRGCNLVLGDFSKVRLP